MELATYFRKDLTNEVKEDILSSFGVVPGAISLESMSPFFDYYQRETLASTILTPPPIKTHEDVASIFKLMKTSFNIPKATMLSTHSERSPAALDLSVRAMLMTACRTPGSFGGDVFNPSWKLEETLEQFIRRVYPRWPAPTDDTRHTPLSVSKLAADCLARDTRVTIRYTERLTDHLELRVGADWKTVYLFKYPCYLRMCLETLQKDKVELNHTTEESLALGCLPPELLIETLATYSLIFSGVDGGSQAMLDTAAKLDPAFSEPFSTYSFQHETPRDARNPENIGDLYEKFPRWGERLEVLFKEIENPTPMTRIEKWSEKRKSPRWTTWWVAVGLFVAILFGVAATAIGALQVWISWCSWMDDPTVSGCSAKPVASPAPSRLLAP
ncbi:hypothetical protein B0T16DRAFT_460246 [Cercophora newfieldiana]|uniref:Uncharacterized protein n=1 Tax=Cercophora newfieldiana TaxID=92897 RepID=A0AA40CP40_9PEZI|nr:hypothetical protein B0T16DRAFT_460246 [Cercophora newfieldiana]